jgi:hypothetical protein
MIVSKFFGKGLANHNFKPTLQVKRKQELLDLLPFNIQGNKAELLFNSLGDLVLLAANNSERVIDAFAGTGLYVHFIRASGIDIPMILNEFDPFRYITHFQIKTNPLGVRIAGEYFLNKLIKFVDLFQDGDIFGPTATATNQDIVDFLQSEARRLIEPGQDFSDLAHNKKPVKMKNTPELAGLYILMQNQKWGYRPIQADATPEGLKRVMTHHEIRSLVKENGKIKKFRLGRNILFNLEERINSVHRRLKNVSICNGDGWKLIKELAGNGDFVPVDTSYLGKDTSNYSKATQEDCDPEIYMNKFRDCILPAIKRGAKVLITNNWDDQIVDRLQSAGLRISMVYRKKGVSRDTTEFAAFNFDPATGTIDT